MLLIRIKKMYEYIMQFINVYNQYSNGYLQVYVYGYTSVVLLNV